MNPQSPPDPPFAQVEKAPSSNTNGTSMTRSRSTKLGLGIGCGLLILCLGITAAVLGAKGYFGFEDPCVGVYDLKVKNLDMTFPENDASSTSNSGILGFIDDVAESLGLGSVGSLASSRIPTQVTMTIELQMEVNNTNPYDMDYEQSEAGVITIPENMGEDNDNNNEDNTETSRQVGSSAGENDLTVATWKIPNGSLKKQAQNIIPVSMVATIDLSASDTLMGMAVSMASNGPIMFEVDGGIEGAAWVPGVSGKVRFLCVARLENTIDAVIGSEDAQIRCSHKVRIGRRLRGLLGTSSGEFELTENLWSLLGEEGEVDPSCIV